MAPNQLDSRAAELLKIARLNKGYNLRQLAAQAGLTASTISRIESGEQKPSLMVVLQLCNSLDISAPALVSQLRGRSKDTMAGLKQLKPSEKIKNAPHMNTEHIEVLVQFAERLLAK